MTLHFNIALTKCNRTLYNIHWRHGGFHTHVKAWQEIGEQIFMCTGELRTDSYAARCQDCFYTTKTDALWLVLIHCLHFPPPPPYLKFIHNKVRILIQGGGVFIPRCFFLISSVFFYFFIMTSSHNFLPAVRDKLWSIVSFSPAPRRSKILGFFGRRQTRFHLLGRSVHPVDAFETSPSVLCQSQSPSWHITQIVIHNLSLFYLPKCMMKNLLS